LFIILEKLIGQADLWIRRFNFELQYITARLLTDNQLKNCIHD